MVGVDYKLERRQRRAKNRRSVSRVGSGMRDLRLNMTGWDPELITASEQALTKPVIHLARFAYARMKRRTFVDGRDAFGRSWGQYSDKRPPSKRRSERENGHLWINPNKPQPQIGKYPIRIRKGPWKGWALYQSSHQYAKAQKKSGITYVNTGTLAQGMQLRPLSPLKMQISFYGGRRKTHDRILGGSDDRKGGRRRSQAKNNRKLAQFLGAKGHKLLELNDQDVDEIRQLAQVILRTELLDLLRFVDDAYKARKALRIRNRAVAKAKRLYEQELTRQQGA